MRILVDLLGFTGGRGGTESYARELLLRLPDVLPQARFEALTGREGKERVEGFFPGPTMCLDWVDAGRSRWAAAEVFAVERTARRRGTDLIWSPANFGPIESGIPRLVTVHDVIYHEVGRSSPTRTITSWLMARSARTATRVLTVSHAASQAIQTHLGIREDRISVVHNGSTEPPPSPAEPWDVVAPIGVRGGRPIVLSTGNRMPHKNFEGLLRAVAVLPPDRRPVTVIPGSHGPDPLEPLVAELDLRRDVVLPGWVTTAQLEALYAVADLYVCPSLTEGFGLPVVDALRRGCAVLANDIDVLREVGGDVASYADARDPQAFALAMQTRLQASKRPGDSARRIAWAQRFSWDAAAAGTAAALGQTLGSPESERR